MNIQIKNLEDLKQFFYDKVDSHLFYLGNEVNQGVGLESLINNYHLICLDDDLIVDYLCRENRDIFCLEREVGRKNFLFRNSYHLLSHPETINYLKSFPEVNLLFFKNSANLEDFSSKNGWKIIAPSAKLARNIDNKLFFKRILEYLEINSPPIIVETLSSLEYDDLIGIISHKFILQFAKSFGGNKTFLIESEEDFNYFKQKFAERRVKLTPFIKGKNFTLNGCITREAVLISGLFYQITGIPALTKNYLGACGNDWLYPVLPDNVEERIFVISSRIGEYIRSLGYSGMFGLDFIIDENNEPFFMEINARLTTSVPMFTKLQLINGEIPLLALHIFEFLKTGYSIDLEELNNRMKLRKKGAQVILHNLEDVPCIVEGMVRPGIYLFKGGKLEFQREAYSIEQCQEEEEVLILAVNKGRLVNPNIECGRIQMKKRAINDDFTLNQEVILLSQKLYNLLQLKPIDEGRNK